MYRFYTLTRDSTISNGRDRSKDSYKSTQPYQPLVFAEAPPFAEGFYDVPRQSVRLQEMEVGAVNLDYGLDPANQSIKLSFIGIPELVMLRWEAEYRDKANIDGVYIISDHRGKTMKVKWKAFQVQLSGTLSQDDVRYWLDHYAARYGVDTYDPMHSDVADIFKITMEFFVVPAPLEL